MTNKRILILIVILLLGTGVLIVQSLTSVESESRQTPHFVDSSPSQDEVFAKPPAYVVVNFERDLYRESSLTLFKEDEKVSEGSFQDSEKLVLRASLNHDQGDGHYIAKYKACFAPEDCHSGRFSFTVDSAQINNYEDLTNQKEITINMVEIKFQQPKIIISSGTRVTWFNQEEPIHFINTDPHPSHTAYLAQNSLEIKKGESYSQTFTQTGEYAYHCSAHVPEGMIGRIIVQ